MNDHLNGNAASFQGYDSAAYPSKQVLGINEAIGVQEQQGLEVVHRQE
jgi:hypothetical protein